MHLSQVNPGAAIEQMRSKSYENANEKRGAQYMVCDEKMAYVHALTGLVDIACSPGDWSGSAELVYADASKTSRHKRAIATRVRFSPRT